MAHTPEVAVTAINVGISAVILVLLLVLTRNALRQGLDQTAARLFLRKKDATRGLVLVLAGLSIFLGSHLLDFYSEVNHLGWGMRVDSVETFALLFKVAGLVQYHFILRLKTRSSQTIVIPEAPSE